GQAVTLRARAASLSAITSLIVTANGRAVALDATGQGTYTPAAPGRYVVVATATDADGQTGTTSNVIKVRHANNNVPPVAARTSPSAGAVVSSALDVTGSVASANLDTWMLQLGLYGGGSLTTVASGAAPVAGGALARLDPGALANGVYALR